MAGLVQPGSPPGQLMELSQAASHFVSLLGCLFKLGVQHLLIYQDLMRMSEKNYDELEIINNAGIARPLAQK